MFAMEAYPGTTVCFMLMSLSLGISVKKEAFDGSQPAHGHSFIYDQTVFAVMELEWYLETISADKQLSHNQ